MSLNTGFFAAFNQRQKQTTIVQRIPIKHHHPPLSSYLKSSRSSSVENSSAKESFLPVISTANGKQEGHRPYRRNDFANNHVFVAKHKLARLFLDQSSPKNIPGKSELTHLFDQHTPKLKTRRVNNNKRQENNSDAKSTPSLDPDVHLSVVNLTMKPSSRNRDLLAPVPSRRPGPDHSRLKTPRPSIEWINPAINQHFQLASKPFNEDNLEPDTIINELMDYNSDIVSSTIHPLDLSVSYVKSIIPSSRREQRGDQLSFTSNK